MKVNYGKDDNRQPPDITAVQHLWLRRIHELFFSLNVALGAVVAVVYGHDGVFVPVYRLEQILYRMGLTGDGGVISGHVALFLCVVPLAALLFLLLRCFGRTSATEHILVSAAGFFAVGAAPACWFYIYNHYGWSWYPVEAVACLLLAALYLSQKWKVPAFVTVLIVCIHCGFWYLRFWEYPHGPAELLVPISGFCTCIVWGVYVLTARACFGVERHS
jgi:hypothetical protein